MWFIMSAVEGEAGYSVKRRGYQVISSVLELGVLTERKDLVF